MTIDKVLNWLSTDDYKKKEVVDCGCGVGSLALPMSKMFKKVYASDISKSMTEEAASRASNEKIKNIVFKVLFYRLDYQYLKLSLYYRSLIWNL
jgi:magnesium-protoporphyrin O-methyltransferase